MFREMRRFKQQITTEECKKVLKEEKRAAFSVIGDEGYPIQYQLISIMTRQTTSFIFMEQKKDIRLMQ